MIPLNWELKWPTNHFRLLIPLNQQEKKRVTGLAGLIDSDYQKEIRLPLHNGAKEEYAWNTRYPLGHLLVLPCPMIKDNGKLQQPNLGKTTKGPDTLGMKIQVNSPSKEPPPAEVLAKEKGNTVIPLYLQEICSKTPSGCLKPWIMPDPIYTLSSYTYRPMIKFRL